MKNKPLVTVYTITRNRADLLPRCMKSVLAQTYNNIEYIIIDSASTDNTKDVVKSFTDSRIKYLHLDVNKTFGECVNMVYEMALGKYVTELDDDDEYHIDKIEKQVKLFETLSEDYGMVYCWMTYYNNSTNKIIRVHKHELRGYVYEDTVECPKVSGTPTLLVRKSIFNEIGRYKIKDEIGVESDWEFASRICKYYMVDYVPESLVNVYESHGHVRMSNAGYYNDENKRYIQFHEFFLSEFSDVFTKYPQKALGHKYALMKCYIMSKNYSEGTKCLIFLIKNSMNFKFIAKYVALIIISLFYGDK